MIAVIIAGIFLIGPIVLAILQAIITLLLIVLGTAAIGLIGFLSYKLRHRHDPPRIRQRPAWQELPRQQPRKALPEAKAQGYIILTPHEYEALKRGNSDAS
jgi:hypothetical protein